MQKSLITSDDELIQRYVKEGFQSDVRKYLEGVKCHQLLGTTSLEMKIVSLQEQVEDLQKELQDRKDMFQKTMEAILGKEYPGIIELERDEWRVKALKAEKDKETLEYVVESLENEIDLLERNN